jgi:hypothetical protein
MSINVSPYRLKGAGDGLGVLVGGLGVRVGWGVADLSAEHDTRREAKTVIKRDTLVFILERILINFLLNEL